MPSGCVRSYIKEVMAVLQGIALVLVVVGGLLLVLGNMVYWTILLPNLRLDSSWSVSPSVVAIGLAMCLVLPAIPGLYGIHLKGGMSWGVPLEVGLTIFVSLFSLAWFAVLALAVWSSDKEDGFR